MTRIRDRKNQIRDRLYLAILDLGPSSPADLAARTGLGPCAVVRCARDWPAYFATTDTTTRGRAAVATIGLHAQLAGAKP